MKDYAHHYFCQSYEWGRNLQKVVISHIAMPLLLKLIGTNRKVQRHFWVRHTLSGLLTFTKPLHLYYWKSDKVIISLEFIVLRRVCCCFLDLSFSILPLFFLLFFESNVIRSLVFVGTLAVEYGAWHVPYFKKQTVLELSHLLITFVPICNTFANISTFSTIHKIWFSATRQILFSPIHHIINT